MLIGERLQKLRMQADYSQQMLAEKLNVSRQTISKWETDRSQPELSLLIQLAQIYQVSLNELVQVETVPGKTAWWPRLKKKLSNQSVVKPTDFQLVLANQQRFYPDLTAQFGLTLTDVIFEINQQRYPQVWRQVRSPYLIELTADSILVKRTDELKLKAYQTLKTIDDTQIQTVTYTIIRTLGAFAGGGIPAPGFGYSYRALLTVQTKYQTAPFYLINQDYQQLAKVLKRVAVQKGIHIYDPMAILPMIQEQSSTTCFDYFENNYQRLAEQAAYPKPYQEQGVM